MTETTQEKEIPQNTLLDLSAPERRARVREADRSALHVFKPIPMQKWFEFQKSINTELIQKGDEFTTSSQLWEAGPTFWEETVERVEGYKVGDDWRQRIPARHRLAAIAALQEVFVAENVDPFDLEASSRVAVLEAAWNLTVYERLLHRFRPHAQEHELKYRRLQSEFVRVKGTRKGGSRILVPARLKAVCELYDELIQEVQGYGLSDRPLSSKEEIVKHMDPIHKQFALMCLFVSADEVRRLACIGVLE